MREVVSAGGGDEHAEDAARDPADAVRAAAGLPGLHQLRQAAGGRPHARRPRAQGTYTH